ncbi:hypothetical protein FRC10_008583 [Ceratobasidium sp. 414]|nr:hypothetical protein FRC10_008583 [Ceratobasidium sp. 414]
MGAAYVRPRCHNRGSASRGANFVSSWVMIGLIWFRPTSDPALGRAYEKLGIVSRTVPPCRNLVPEYSNRMPGCNQNCMLPFYVIDRCAPVSVGFACYDETPDDRKMLGGTGTYASVAQDIKPDLVRRSTLLTQSTTVRNFLYSLDPRSASGESTFGIFDFEDFEGVGVIVGPSACPASIWLEFGGQYNGAVVPHATGGNWWKSPMMMITMDFSAEQIRQSARTDCYYLRNHNGQSHVRWTAAPDAQSKLLVAPSGSTEAAPTTNDSEGDIEGNIELVTLRMIIQFRPGACFVSPDSHWNPDEPTPWQRGRSAWTNLLSGHGSLTVGPVPESVSKLLHDEYPKYQQVIDTILRDPPPCFTKMGFLVLEGNKTYYKLSHAWLAIQARQLLGQSLQAIHKMVKTRQGVRTTIQMTDQKVPVAVLLTSPILAAIASARSEL